MIFITKQGDLDDYYLKARPFAILKMSKPYCHEGGAIVYKPLFFKESKEEWKKTDWIWLTSILWSKGEYSFSFTEFAFLFDGYGLIIPTKEVTQIAKSYVKIEMGPGLY